MLAVTQHDYGKRGQKVAGKRYGENMLNPRYNQ